MYLVQNKFYMIYRNQFINIISFILSIIIFFSFSFILENTSKENFNNSEQNLQDNIIQGNENEEEKDLENLKNWYIEIPSISLIAPIEEGTSKEVLNNKVGHFEETSRDYGNVGLAAHNRGYEKNYFENLKNVNIGDEIIYNYYDLKIKYIIDKNEIIKNNDWTYLENTEENKITLITCVENQPEFRRCVQASEIN